MKIIIIIMCNRPFGMSNHGHYGPFVIFLTHIYNGLYSVTQVLKYVKVPSIVRNIN